MWQALQAIPVGKKVTYAEVARRIGSLEGGARGRRRVLRRTISPSPFPAIAWSALTVRSRDMRGVSSASVFCSTGRRCNPHEHRCENITLIARSNTSKLRGAKATRDAIAGLCQGDPAKALVIKYIGQLVAEGFAEWDRLDAGDVRLRFNTGETVLLTETGIVRLT